MRPTSTAEFQMVQGFKGKIHDPNKMQVNCLFIILTFGGRPHKTQRRTWVCARRFRCPMTKPTVSKVQRHAQKNIRSGRRTDREIEFKLMTGTSLAVQWLRLCTSNAGGKGSVPSQGTEIPHAVWRGKKKKKSLGEKPQQKGRSWAIRLRETAALMKRRPRRKS